METSEPRSPAAAIFTSSSEPNEDDREPCPNCGEWVSPQNYDYNLGWCKTCSPENGRNKLRAVSQLESYLERYADELEYYLSQGKSIFEAIDRVVASEVDKCVSCGEVIARGRKPRIFCRNYRMCRRMSRRYVYLYRERGMTKAQALAQVMSSLG